MRIHRIHLQHVAGVDDRALTFGDGVTVVVGPNEAGKSTIATALHLLLEQKDRYDNAEIRSVRPVHRDADPTIELECTTGPYRLTYRKVFGRTAGRRETALTIHTPSPQSLTGDAAHDRMTAILDETVDEQLWAALRVQQRRDVGQADLAASGALAAALDAASSNASASADDGALLARIDEAAAEFWSDTGRPRKPLKEGDARVEQAAAVLDAARAELAAARTATDQHDRLLDQLAGWRRALPALELRAKETAEAVAEVQDHRDALASAQRVLADADAAVTSAQDRHADRLALVHRVRDLRAAAGARHDEATRTATAVAGAEADVIEARRDRDDARTDLDRARVALRDAEVDVRLLRLSEDRDRLRQRIDAAVALQEQREHALARLDDEAPSAAAIRRLERLEAELRTAAAVLEADLPRVRIEGPADGRVSLAGSVVALDGGAVDRSVDRELTVTIGKHTVTIQPGASATELADRHSDARHALRAALDQLGVSDVAAARARRDAAADAARDLDRTKVAWAEVAKADGVAGLQSALQRTTDDRDELRAQRADDRPLPIDLRTADRLVAARRSEVAADEGTVATADAALEAAVTRATTAQTTATGAAVQRDVARERLDEATAALDAARTTVTDDELVAAIDGARAATVAARRDVGAAGAVLDGLDVDVIEADATAASARLSATRRQMADADTRRAELWGRISVTMDRGLGERVPQLEAELAEVRATRDALQRRADALLLLRTTFHAHRDAATARYQAPLKEQIERLGRVVFGESFEVRLDQSLRVAERTLHGRTLTVEQLSGGAQEQLAIITRLAAASVVSPEDGVPLILDDALGYADPTRTDRVNTLLSAVGQDSQVIVLTCDPDRFTGIRGAQVLTLA